MRKREKVVDFEVIRKRRIKIIKELFRVELKKERVRFSFSFLALNEQQSAGCRKKKL